MSEAILILVLIAVALIAWLASRVGPPQRRVDELPASLAQGMEQQHRAMLVNLHDGLGKQGDRLAAALTDNSERLRSSTADELKQKRATLHALQLALSESLGLSREAMAE